MTALRQVLLLHAEALGLTPKAMTMRVRRWGLAQALTTPARTSTGQIQTALARALAWHYCEHPEDTPPWAWGEKGIN
jgi:hypothetical protein